MIKETCHAEPCADVPGEATGRLCECTRQRPTVTTAEGWSMPVLSTLAAMAIGGWPGLVPHDREPTPVARAGSGALELVRRASGCRFFTDRGQSTRSASAPAVRRCGGCCRAWPIVLHRAGDGRFYADLTLDGHIVNILVDPASAAVAVEHGAAAPRRRAEPRRLAGDRGGPGALPPARDTFCGERGSDAGSGARRRSAEPPFQIDEAFDRLQLAADQCLKSA